MRGTELAGQLQLVGAQVHRDDRIGASDRSRAHRRESYSSDPEHGHRLTRLHPRGVDHRPGAGKHRAADDRAQVGRLVGADRHQVLFRNQGVLAPGEHRPRDEAVPVRGPAGTVVLSERQRLAPHPGNDGVVPLPYPRHGGSGAQHHAGGLVAERGRPRPGIVQFVDLRVADAAGEQLQDRLVRTRIGKIELIDDERLAAGGLDGGARGHRHGVLVPHKRQTCRPSTPARATDTSGRSEGMVGCDHAAGCRGSLLVQVERGARVLAPRSLHRSYPSAWNAFAVAASACSMSASVCAIDRNMLCHGCR